MSNLPATPKMGTTALATVADQKTAIAARLSELPISRQTSSVVMAQLTGLRIDQATDAQLSSMWNEVIGLFQIQFEADSDDEEWFWAEVQNVSDWLRRERPSTTCEQVRKAYNLLVNEELKKGDGRVLEAYPKITPRHVGEVLAAYRRHVEGMAEVTQVISTGLYLPPPAEATPEQIDALMEHRLREAIQFTKIGGIYFDLGNGLYTWLYSKKRIDPSKEEWEAALIEAQKQIRDDLAIQKEEMAAVGQDSLRIKIGQRLADVMNEEGDYKKRVRQQAFRICLTNYLSKRVGQELAAPAKPQLRLTPKIESDFKPFSHARYVEELKTNLPTMSDEAVSDLQRKARIMNVLDVYELSTEEWNKRTAKK